MAMVALNNLEYSNLLNKIGQKPNFDDASRRYRELDKKSVELSRKKWDLRAKYPRRLIEVSGSSADAFHTEFDKLVELEDKIFEEKMRLAILLLRDAPPVISDGVIELRVDRPFDLDSPPFNLLIVRCIDKEEVGGIDYRGYHVDPFLADVGYHIWEPFERKGYCTRAFALLSEFLYERGIPDFWVSTYNDNVASKRIIEKYGSIPVGGDKSYTLYQTTTAKRKTENQVK